MTTSQPMGNSNALEGDRRVGEEAFGLEKEFQAAEEAFHQRIESVNTLLKDGALFDKHLKDLIENPDASDEAISYAQKVYNDTLRAIETEAQILHQADLNLQAVMGKMQPTS